MALEDDALWFKDAVIYQVHVKSFFDANDDGIGDFKGLAQKIDYIKNLGATCIWLLPFYPSPLRDDGYDIADYRGVNPAYGTLRDFRPSLLGKFNTLVQILGLTVVLVEQVWPSVDAVLLRVVLLKAIAWLAPISAAQYAWIVVQRVNAVEPPAAR